MSQLIQMRQRIKAIGTIKKITSAMRLISRSFHMRMHRDRTHLQDYTQALTHIFNKTIACTGSTVSHSYEISAQQQFKELYIIIGSQKGLCGSFNTTITHWIDKNRETLLQPQSHVLVLGKKINEYLKKQGVLHAQLLPELKLITIDALVKNILNTMTDKKRGYTKVVAIANSPKTFFSHEYKVTQLIPFVTPQTTCSNDLFDYTQVHDPKLIIETLTNMHLMVSVHSLLFESLLGEQASRFIAMDNATRNANKFLDTMKLQFNKMRQAKITKELTELAGAFETQF